MFRRNPTRIELKVDDLHEYDLVRKEIEEKKSTSSNSKETDSGDINSQSQKSKQSIIAERIGYKPHPRVGS